MMNFSEAKSILESIAKLVKTTATLDLHEKIAGLREFIIEIKDENIALKEENQSLKLQLSTEQDFTLKSGLYWKENDEVPFCPTCLDSSKKRIRLQLWGPEDWQCLVCKNYYKMPRGQAGVGVIRGAVDENRDEYDHYNVI